MKRNAYELLRSIELSWWYKGRASAVRALLARAGTTKKYRALDFGAGFGGMRSELAQYANSVDAIEPDAEARTAASKRGYAQIYGTSEAIEAGAYDLVGVLDVLEHIKDDHAFLVRIKDALAPEGVLVITVPAFPFLWSTHDETHLHFRRYTRNSLQKALKRAGYEITQASYWNFSLFPMAALMRLIGRTGEEGLVLPKPINQVLWWVVSIEAKIIQYLSLPWGISLVAIARPATQNSTRPSLHLLHGFISRYSFLLRYLMVGLSGGLIQTFVLYLWVDQFHMQDSYLMGVVIGFLIALAATFLLQKYWTFRDHSSHRTHKQFISYTIVALGNLALNTLFISGMKAVFDAEHANFFDGWYLLAQVMAVGLVAGMSFVANYFFTFRDVRKSRD